MGLALPSRRTPAVAPLAGSVDRNSTFWRLMPGVVRVAPLAGSVDRNGYQEAWADYRYQSLPSRGAWIEIKHWQTKQTWKTSLPSRGAWIEIRGTPGRPRPPESRSPRGERG